MRTPALSKAIRAIVLISGSLVASAHCGSQASEAVQGIACPRNDDRAYLCRLADALRSNNSVQCETVFEFGVGQRRFCGTFAELEREVLVCRARYQALSDREQNNFVGTNLSAHCNALQQAKDKIVTHAHSRERERQRIEDAQRQLRALGVER
jgi:hypothetical protein